MIKHLEIEIMNKLFELISWLKIFLSPVLLSLVPSYLIYRYASELIWLSVLLIFFGVVFGVIWAQRIQKKKGASQFLSEISSSPDIMDYDEINLN